MEGTRIGIISLYIGSIAILIYDSLQGSKGGDFLTFLGITAFVISWIWVIVLSVQAQRWGWLTAHLLIGGISIPLFALTGAMQPTVTGAQGVDKQSPQNYSVRGSYSTGANPQWEFCEIEFYTSGYDSGYFAANAVGPRGQYVASQNRGRCGTESLNFLTAGVSTGPGKGSDVLINELISALTADGWELTGQTGRNWWNHKFRRPVTR